MRLIRFIYIAIIINSLVYFGYNNAIAQEIPSSNEEVIKVRTNLVTVTAHVTDERARHVTGLTRDDFMIRDKGRVVQIDYFAVGTDRVALVFALDASGSGRDIITQQRETALALFSKFGRGSSISVFHFLERPELVLSSSSQPSKVRTAFRFTAKPNRRTAIFDAALAATRSYDGRPMGPPERRIVVLVTDGLDTASTVPFKTVIAEAQERNVSFYVINFPLFVPRYGRLAPRRPVRGLRDMAERTGGRYFVVGDAQAALNPRAEYDLRPVFEAIADDLQSQYTLGFYARDTVDDNVRVRAPEVGLVPTRARRYRVKTRYR